MRESKEKRNNNKKGKVKDKKVKTDYENIRDNIGLARNDFYMKFDNKCVYCGADLTIANKMYSSHIDHIYPRKFNVIKSIDKKFDFKKYISEPEDINHVLNLVPSCSICNLSKSNKLLLKKFHPKYAQYTNYIKIKDYHFVLEAEHKFDDEVLHFYKTLGFNKDRRFHINIYTRLKELLNMVLKDIENPILSQSQINIIKELMEWYDNSVLYKKI